MPGRGPLTFKKKQRELQQKEKQAEKLMHRLERNRKRPDPEENVVQGSDPASGDPSPGDLNSE